MKPEPGAIEAATATCPETFRCTLLQPSALAKTAQPCSEPLKPFSVTVPGPQNCSTWATKASNSLVGKQAAV